MHSVRIPLRCVQRISKVIVHQCSEHVEWRVSDSVALVRMHILHALRSALRCLVALPFCCRACLVVSVLVVLRFAFLCCGPPTCAMLLVRNPQAHIVLVICFMRLEIATNMIYDNAIRSPQVGSARIILRTPYAHRFRRPMLPAELLTGEEGVCRAHVLCARLLLAAITNVLIDINRIKRSPSRITSAFLIIVRGNLLHEFELNS